MDYALQRWRNTERRREQKFNSRQPMPEPMSGFYDAVLYGHLDIVKWFCNTQNITHDDIKGGFYEGCSGKN